MIEEEALRKLDWVFDEAGKRGMFLELILWGYGAAGGQGMWGHASRENAWVDALARRFVHRPNLFCYTIANEFERYPDGKYDYAAGDVAWVRRMATRIHGWDAARPVGCHPSVWITDQGTATGDPRPFATFQGFTQRRPQIVWPLWDGSEVNLNVTQNLPGGSTGMVHELQDTAPDYAFLFRMNPEATRRQIESHWGYSIRNWIRAAGRSRIGHPEFLFERRHDYDTR